MTQRNSPERKAALASRRTNQLSRQSGFVTHKGAPEINRRGNTVVPFLVRPSGRIFASLRTRVRPLPPLPGENLIKRNDGVRIHPTKGLRPLTAYEKQQVRG